MSSFFKKPANKNKYKAQAQDQVPTEE